MQLICLYILLIISQVCSKSSIISHAISEVVRQHFERNSIRFNLVELSDSNDDDHFGDIKIELPHKIVRIFNESEGFEQTDSAIFKFDSFNSYWNFDRNQRRYTNFGPVNINNLVYCSNATSLEIEMFVQKFQ